METFDGTGLTGTVKVIPVDVCVPTRTTTGPVIASRGTTACKDAAVAAVTVARTEVLFAPARVTMMSAALALNPLPAIVTTVPGNP